MYLKQKTEIVYPPNGMLIPGRSFTSEDYRFGINGKDNDNEVKGNGYQQDYGMRIYDPRLVRFLSIDPLFNIYPFYLPYHFASNTPIAATDEDGLEADIKFNNFERNDRKAAEILYPGDKEKQQEYIRGIQRARAYGILAGGAAILKVVTAGEITPL